MASSNSTLGRGACADNAIRLLDAATLREVAELRGHGAYVHAVRFSPDGTRLASASGDHTVRIWDTVLPAERLRARDGVRALRPAADALVDRLPQAHEAAEGVIRLP